LSATVCYAPQQAHSGGDEVLQRRGAFARPESAHALNDAVSEITPVSVLGAVRLPIKVTDLDSLILGKSVFVLEKIDYWREYSLLVPNSEIPRS
jgi:hypothetical protein